MQFTDYITGHESGSDSIGGALARRSRLSIRAPRVELLVAPRDLLGMIDPARLASSIAATLDAPRAFLRECGEFDLYVITDGRRPKQTDSRLAQNLDLVEGLWPEPVGMHVETSGTGPLSSWRIEADHYGVRPIFFGSDSQKRPIVSTRPDVVAALLGSRPCPRSIAEHLLIGFNLDDHSPYEGVRRLRPGERLLFSAAFGFRLAFTEPDNAPRGEGADPAAWIESTAPIIVEAFRRGDALELSGGVDSRLVLALGLHHGAKPRLAFTLGREDDEDVAIAGDICRNLGIEHHVLPVELDAGRTAGDGRDFVTRAGFGVNACSYAWLPSAFRRISHLRTHQIGGGGGECATGFYYSPLDALCRSAPVRLMWVHKRLFRPGVQLDALLRHQRCCELTDDIADTATRLLGRLPGNWRQRTDEFYLTQRVPNSGGAVLSASACWYQPLQPLLHSPYIEWGRTLSPARRSDRRTQMHVIHELHAELGSIPYSAGRIRASSASAMIRKLSYKAGSSVGKITRRLINRRAKADLGAASTAAILVGDETVRRSLEGLASCAGLGFCPEHLSRMLASPRSYEYELGVLISAGWANDSLRSLRSRWHNSESCSTNLRAA